VGQRSYQWLTPETIDQIWVRLRAGQAAKPTARRLGCRPERRIVMERYQIDEERAFDLLVRISRDSNVKLRDVAVDFVTGLSSRSRLEQPD
jgi:hypothetical protein